MHTLCPHCFGEGCPACCSADRTHILFAALVILVVVSSLYFERLS